MGWTDRSDMEPCCGDSPGAVGDAEKLARLLHSGISVPERSRIKRQELWPTDKKKSYSDTCGSSDGASVNRCSQMRDDEVRRWAKDYAEKRRHTSEGAIVAQASALRQITYPGEKGRVVFIYDDPRCDDETHAVIRASDTVPRTDQDRVRDAVLFCFKDRVLP